MNYLKLFVSQFTFNSTNYSVNSSDCNLYNSSFTTHTNGIMWFYSKIIVDAFKSKNFDTAYRILIKQLKYCVMSHDGIESSLWRSPFWFVHNFIPAIFSLIKVVLWTLALPYVNVSLLSFPAFQMNFWTDKAINLE